MSLSLLNISFFLSPELLLPYCTCFSGICTSTWERKKYNSDGRGESTPLWRSHLAKCWEQLPIFWIEIYLMFLNQRIREEKKVWLTISTCTSQTWVTKWVFKSRSGKMGILPNNFDNYSLLVLIFGVGCFCLFRRKLRWDSRYYFKLKTTNILNDFWLKFHRGNNIPGSR